MNPIKIDEAIEMVEKNIDVTRSPGFYDLVPDLIIMVSEKYGLNFFSKNDYIIRHLEECIRYGGFLPYRSPNHKGHEILILIALLFPKINLIIVPNLMMHDQEEYDYYILLRGNREKEMIKRNLYPRQAIIIASHILINEGYFEAHGNVGRFFKIMSHLNEDTSFVLANACSYSTGISIPWLFVNHCIKNIFIPPSSA